MHAIQAAVDRPLPLRMRADLVVREASFRGRRHFILKDPVTFTYACLTEQEYFVVRSLNGETSSTQIQQRFRERFAPQQLTTAQLQSFVSQLHRQGLVLSDVPGQGLQLANRKAAKNHFNLLRLAERLLALRWRGINPEPVLGCVEPALGWLFSWRGFALWLAFVGWAASLAVLHLDEITKRLPDAAGWLSDGNLLWLGIATILVKTLHELGHAVAARRLGCRCREMGVQFFFLLPCLYTDVSDIWLVPSKWRRIVVSAAGIYVELLLAAIAALVWWAAEPGVLSSLCLNVMLVASLGTLVLNGNPLMRYDGYYILADLIEVPNLEQQSRTQLVAWVARWCCGIDSIPADGLSHRARPLLAIYAAAAIAYRTAVLVGVYFASRALLAPWRLEPASDLLLAGALMGMIIPLAVTGGQLIVQARRRNQLHPGRIALAGAILAGLCAAALLIPLPQRITAPVVIEPRGASRVYVTVLGTVVESLKAGTPVRRGDVIVRLDSPELSRDVVRLESELRREQLHLTHLEAARGDDRAAAAAIPTTQQSVADLTDRLAQLRELVNRLTLRAPQDGVILPPPHRQQEASPRQLVGWSGTPLDPANRGCFLETGTLVCLVGKPGEIEAVAVVEQGDVTFVQSNCPARVALAQWPHGTIAGTTEQLARIETEDLPINLAATGAIPQKRDIRGAPRPLATTYQVRIRLTNPPADVLPGSVGRVQIVAPPLTIAARLTRWLSKTFRFEAS
jgi:putative peptide zinc metalloprotease protein